MRTPRIFDNMSQLVAHEMHRTYFESKSGLIVSVDQFWRRGPNGYDDVPLFKKWLRAAGWQLRRTYAHESQRRSFTATGVGAFAGVSAMATWRAKRVDYRTCDVSIESHISMFFAGINLGQFDIKWLDFVQLDPADPDFGVMSEHLAFRIENCIRQFTGFGSSGKAHCKEGGEVAG